MESVIAEGKTTNEAIENGLKQLKVSKDRVEIKILEKKYVLKKNIICCKRRFADCWRFCMYRFDRKSI